MEPQPAAASEFERALLAHAQYFAALLGSAGPLLSGAGRADGGAAQLRAVGDITTDLANILAALETALERWDEPALLQMASHLHLCLNMAGETELGLEMFERLAAAAARHAAAPLQVRAQLGLAHALERQGNYRRARSAADDALSLALELDEQLFVAKAHIQLGNLDYRQGDIDSALERFTLVLELRAAAGHEIGTARALNSLGMAQTQAGLLEAGLDSCQRSLAMRLALGDRQGEASVYNNLGIVMRQLGRLDEAQALYEQALLLRQEFGDRAGEAMALNNLAGVHYERGDYAATIQSARASLAICNELGYPYGVALAQDLLSRAAVRLGDDAAARPALAAAIRFSSERMVSIELLHSLVVALGLVERAGNWRAAALLLHGTVQHCKAEGALWAAELAEQHALSQARLDQAVAAGALEAEEYVALQQRARQLGLPTLAKLALEALTAP